MSGRARYLGFAAACLAGCVVIARWCAGQPFVRGFVGDIVVVALLYFLMKAVREVSAVRLAATVFALAVMVECAQYALAAGHVDLPRTPLVQLTVGSVFDPADLLAYGLGALLAYLADMLTKPRTRCVGSEPAA